MLLSRNVRIAIQLSNGLPSGLALRAWGCWPLGYRLFVRADYGET